MYNLPEKYVDICRASVNTSQILELDFQPAGAPELCGVSNASTWLAVTQRLHTHTQSMVRKASTRHR